MKSIEIDNDGSVRINGFNYKQSIEIIDKVKIKIEDAKEREIGFKNEK